MEINTGAAFLVRGVYKSDGETGSQEMFHVKSASSGAWRQNLPLWGASLGTAAPWAVLGASPRGALWKGLCFTGLCEQILLLQPPGAMSEAPVCLELTARAKSARRSLARPWSQTAPEWSYWWYVPHTLNWVKSNTGFYAEWELIWDFWMVLVTPL